MPTPAPPPKLSGRTLVRKPETRKPETQKPERNVSRETREAVDRVIKRREKALRELAKH